MSGAQAALGALVATLSASFEHVAARLDLAALNVDVPTDPAAVEPKPWDQHSGELCQLVTDYDPKFLPSGGAIVERKHDGWRAIWLRGELVSRSGATLWSTAHLWPALRELEARFGEPMTFHGEYVVAEDFMATSSECNSAKNAAMPVEGRGVLHLFDAVPVQVWDGRERGHRLEYRKYLLKGELANLRSYGTRGYHLHFVDHKAAHSDWDVQPMFDIAERYGHEGIVIKDPRSFHAAGRSRTWMRLKRSLTLDLRVIGYTEQMRKVEGVKGGVPDGVLGSITVDNGGKPVKVGIGFDERERAVLWHHPDRLIGRIAEIAAMEITDNGSLRQPRFLRWRDDKA